MEGALAKFLTSPELKLLKSCKGFNEVFLNQDPEKPWKSVEIMLKFITLDFNDKMKKALSQTPHEFEMYPHVVADFNYSDNNLLKLLKRCVLSQRRSVAQKRKRNTACGSKRKKGPTFTLENVHPDVRPLIKDIDRWEYEDMGSFVKFLNENFGKPYGCEKLTDKAERVFLMDKLLRRMYTSGFFQDVKKFSDEGDTIKNFLRPGRTWKVRRDKIEQYNLAFRALQNLHFGRYESSKGFEHKGTTACMEMFRALGFTPPDKAKAHASPHYRGPSATDPTKVQDGQGNPKCGRDVLYIGEFEHNTRNVRTNLHYLWEDARHQPKKFVNSNKRNVEVLLEAAQVVDSESSSERAPEPNSLGYSCKRACFGPK